MANTRAFERFTSCSHYLKHRGNYKTASNSVAAFDENGQQIGIVFETASSFDTPRDTKIAALDRFFPSGITATEATPHRQVTLSATVSVRVHGIPCHENQLCKCFNR